MTDSPANGAAISDPDAIRNIIGGFSLCLDVDPVENLKRLLDSHVVIETRGADRVGGTDYVERGLVGYLAKMRRLRDSGKAGPDSLRRHVVVPITVNVEGDNAGARSHFMFATVKPATLHSLGMYEDSFRRTRAGWRLTHRVIVYG